jgi:hypothetical protein
MKTRKQYSSVLRALFVVSTLVAMVHAEAAQVQLIWQPVTTHVDGSPATDLSHYDLHYGQVSGEYGTVRDVGNVTSYTLAGLTEGQTYYFAVTAVSSSGTSSDFSNEVRYTVPAIPGSSEAVVYVAYDSRAAAYPTWLNSDYNSTGETIQTADVSLSVWRRNVPAGHIALPGNKYGSPSGVSSNYIVLIDLPDGGGISGLIPNDYELTRLNVGDQYYIDRTYTITGMPNGLRGLWGIRTANNDKNNALAEFISFTLEFDDSGPHAEPDWAATTENNPVTIDVLANDSHPDNDALMVRSVTQPNHGAVVVDADGTVTYTPAVGFSGVDKFTYVAEDEGGLTSEATVTVTVADSGSRNKRPVAVDDSASTVEGTAVTVAVLKNDSDPDSDVLTVSGADSSSNGTVAINGDNTVTYTPDDGFKGIDSFGYTISDGNGGSATASVTVTVKDPTEMVWLEAEEGWVYAPMEIGLDDTASAGQYIWVPEEEEDIVDPTQEAGFAELSFNVAAADNYAVWGRVRHNSANQGSFFLAMDADVLGAGTVTELTPMEYEVVSNFGVAEEFYIDRTYTITALPAELDGLVGIKTANNDKYNTDAEFLTFTIDQDATLYVLYDARASRYPDWLVASYTNTGETIQTTDTSFSVWQRQVLAGAMAIPGNHYGDPNGSYSNYFVLLDFDGQGGGVKNYHVWQIAAPAVGDGAVEFINPSSEYQVTNLGVDDEFYIDRTYTITALPAELDGLVGIKTANDDKYNTDAEFLAFTIDQDATLYVLYDARASRYPDWLVASYTNTGQTIHTTDTSFTVWQRQVLAGATAIPGNHYGDPSGSYSNYFVLLDFEGQAAPQTWLWNPVRDEVSGTPLIFYLQEGMHVLEVKQRESGTKADEILITNDLDFVPQN